MSEFNVDEYFKRLSDIKNTPLDTTLMSSKELEVQAAGQRKREFLDSIQAVRDHNLKNSAAGELGLNPEGLTGGFVNGVAKVGNEVVRLGSDIAQLPLLANKVEAAFTTTDGAEAAYQAYKRGEATPEDYLLLNKRTNIIGQAEEDEGFLNALGTYTNMERLELADSSEKSADWLENNVNIDQVTPLSEKTGEREAGLLQRVVGDTSIALVKGAVGVPEMAVGLANMVSGGQAGKSLEEMGVRFKDAKEILDSFLSREQQEANAAVLNSEGFHRTLGKLVTSPTVALQFLAESLPAMLAGGVIGKGVYKGAGLVNKLLSNGAAAAGRGAQLSAGIGEGLVMSGAMAEGIRQQTEDGLLTNKQIGLSALMAPVGAAVSVGGGALSKALRLGDIDRAMVTGSFEKLSGSRSVNMVGSALIEGGEEQLQTMAETATENIALGRKWDEGMGNAAAIGLVTGASLGAPAGLSQAEKNKRDTRKEKEETLKSAIDTGDVTPFTDPKSSSYQPALAVAILQEHSKKEGTTAEDKARIRKQAEEVELSIQRELNKDKELAAINSPDNYKKIVESTNAMEAEIAAGGETLTPERKAELTSFIQMNKGMLLSSKEKKRLDKRIESNTESLAAIQVASNSWAQQDNEVGTEIGDLIAAASQIPDVADTESMASVTSSVEQVINLAMSSPDSFSDESLRGLSTNKASMFSADQRGMFAGILVARESARQAKSMSTVASEVFEGDGEGNIGLNEYDAGIRNAIGREDGRSAKSLLTAMSSFVSGHQKKAQMMNQLFKTYKETGEVGFMIPAGNKGSGDWAIAPAGMSAADVIKAGGYEVGGALANTVKQVTAEARAGEKMRKAALKAATVKFGSEMDSFKSKGKSLSEIQEGLNEGTTEQVDDLKASAASVASGTKVIPEKYAALKAALSTEDFKRLNTLYSENKVEEPVTPVTPTAATTPESAATPTTPAANTGPSDKEKAFKASHDKAIRQFKARLTARSKKDPSKLALQDESLINMYHKLEERINDPAEKAFIGLNKERLELVKAEIVKRKISTDKEATREEQLDSDPNESQAGLNSEAETASNNTSTETLSSGKKVTELTSKEVIDALLKALDRVRIIHMSAAKGDGRALVDIDEARSDVTKLMAVAEGLDEKVKALYLQILNDDKPLSLVDATKWLMAHTGPVHSSLLTKINTYLKDKKFNGFTFIGSEVAMPTGGKAIPAGLFYRDDKIVGLNPLSTIDAPHPTTQEMVVTMMHELIHATVDDLIESSPEFRAKVGELQEKVREFLNSKESKGLTHNQRSNLEYSVSSEYEFFSTIVSDPEMMNIVDSIKTDSGRSIVTEFIVLVVNALRKTMHLTVPEATLLTDTLVLFSQAIGDTPIAAPPTSSKVFGFTLRKRNNHTPKDQLKADKASAFIGAGAPDSATNDYIEDATAAGIPVNSLDYTSDDVVFVSANGARKDRVKMVKDNPLAKPVFAALDAAIAAGATIIADEKGHRERKFNVGEREIATYLSEKGYEDTDDNGTWVAANKTAEVTTAAEGTPVVYTDDLQQLMDEAFDRSEEDYYSDRDAFSESVPPAWYDEEGIPLADESGQVTGEAKTEAEIAAEKEAELQTLIDSFEGDVTLAEAEMIKREKERLATSLDGNALDGEENHTTAASKFIGSREGVITLDKTEREGAASTYQGKNLIAHFFKQAGEKENSLTPKPLVAIKDFLSALINKTVTFQDFVPTGLNDGQDAILLKFVEVAPVWQAKMKELIIDKYYADEKVDHDYDYMYPLRYLVSVDADGTTHVDENVLTGMTSAMFSWLIEEGGSTERANEQKLNSIIGATGGSSVPPAVWNLLGMVGSRRTLVSNTLGQRFFQHMGLKAANKDIPVSLQPQIEATLGGFMLVVFEVMGYTEETRFSRSEILAAQGLLEKETAKRFKALIKQGKTEEEASDTIEAENAKEQRSDIFVKVRRVESLPKDAVGTGAVYETANIVNLASGTSGVFDKMMGTEFSGREPTLVPTEFNPKDQETDHQKVPHGANKTLNEISQIMIRFYKPTLKVIRDIGGGTLDVFEKMSGVKEITNKNTHKALRMSSEAKNEGLRREITNFQNFLKFLNTTEGGEGTPFYNLTSFWSNQRVGQDGIINGQTSKIHRWMMYTGMGITTVNLSSENEGDGLSSLDNFKLRVLEAFDVKTDAQADMDTLQLFDAKVGTPAIKAGVALMQKMVFDVDYKATVDDQNTLLAAVASTGTLMHGFAGLMALAHMQQALDNGETSFDTSLAAEVDGKTNGPMLSMWLLGTMDAATSSMGGFFNEASGAQSYGAWKSNKGNHDLYQRTATHLNMAISDQMARDPELAAIYGHLFNITGHFEHNGTVSSSGRQVVKDALNPLTYGSAISKAIQGMADAYIDNIYQRLGDISMGKQYGNTGLTEEAALAAIKLDLNTLMGTTNPKHPQHWAPKTIEDAMELVLTNKQEAALRSKYTQTVGEAMEGVIEEDFREYLVTRSQIISTADVSFKIYSAVYEALYEQELNTLMDAGTINSRVLNGKRVPIHDLTRNQLEVLQAKLKEIEPRMETVMSKEDGAEDSLDRGTFLAREGKEISDNHAYEGRAQVPHLKAEGRTNGGKVSAKAGNGFKLTLKAPGAAVLTNAVHSTDSSIMQKVVAKFAGLGVHDAIIVGIKDAAAAGRALNKATAEVLLTHSIPRESLETLERSYIALAKLLKDNPTDATLKKAVADMQWEMYRKLPMEVKETLEPSGVLMYNLNQINNTAYNADVNRLTGLSSLMFVDQYTIESGVYEVPQEYRDRAVELREALTDSLNEDVVTAISEIVAMTKFKSNNGSGNSTSTPAAKTKTTKVKPDAISHTAVGHSEFQADKDLVAFLSSGKKVTARSLAAYLRNRAAADAKDHPNGIGTFYNQLMPKLHERILKAADFDVVYLTKDSTLEIPEGRETAFGWFTNDGKGNRTIYIRGTDFKHSAVSFELAVHELLHAVVTQIIAQNLPLVQPIIAELKEMMDATRKSLKGNKVALRRFHDALNDVQEYVTWGMTNTDFQKILVNQEYVSNYVASNPISNFAQKLYEQISKLIFGNDKNANQLSVLMAHVSTLMDNSSLSAADVSLTQNMSADTNPELDISSKEMFEALANEPGAVTDPAFKAHLEGLLDGMVSKLQGPYQSLFNAARANQAITPLDAWAKARDTGMLPFRSSLTNAGFNLGEQTAFVTEMVQMVIASSMEDMSQPAEKALLKLVKEAREQIKPSDLNADPIVAAAQWKLLFEAPEGDQTGHWRANIVALALTHKPIADLMMFATQTNTDQPTATLYGRMLNWFNSLLNWLYSGAGKAFGGQKGMDKLEVISNRMVDLQVQRLARIKSNKRPNIVEQAEAILNGAGEKVKDRVTAYGDKLRDSNSNNLVKVTGLVISTVSDQRLGKLMGALESVYLENTTGKLGFIAKMYEEVRGSTEKNEWARVTHMMAKYTEQNRHDIATITSRTVLESYANSGKDITPELSTAITKALLHTGAHVLLKEVGITRLQEILADPVELQKEIDIRNLKLTGANAEYYKNQSVFLGYYLATGYVKGHNLRMNALSIARLDGTAADKTQLTDRGLAEDSKVIDGLASLHALRFTGKGIKDLVVAQMGIEAAREGKANGIEFTMQLHGELLDQARERVFAGSELLMAKGYVPQIVNPKIQLVTAPFADKAMMEQKGYKHEGAMQSDTTHPTNKGDHLYSIERGMTPYVSGTLSTKGMNSAGTEVHTGLTTNGGSTQNNVNTRIHNSITRRKAKYVAELFRHRPNLDPSTDIEQYLAPVSNADGETVNYRYIMGNDTRDVLQDRNNSFDKVLGTLASNTYDKETTKTHNTKVVKALHEEWLANRLEDKHAYMVVSDKSTDPEVVSAFRKLPFDTRQEILKVWGADGMMVRRDTYDLHFGYRKFSIADMFGKPSDERNQLERFLVKFFEGLPYMGSMAEQRLRTLEDVSQFIVREIKDILVVKTGMTLFWNMVSNISLLAVYGVGPIDMIRYHREAYMGITAWNKDEAELRKLELMRSSGHIIGTASELDQAITELKEQMARNPVRGLVEAGMQPSIVEDVNLVDDLYTYKSKLQNKVEAYTNKVPQTVRTVAKHLYVAHDTPLYKVLAHGTQVSDFVAKYTLYMKTTKRAIKPLTHSAAVTLATGAFVNYDLPSHKGLQYANDMGLVMFTKYYMRIQHAMLHMYRDNPARALMLLTFDSYFSGMQTIADSSFLRNINSPFTVGPFNIFESLDEGMPAWMLGKLFK